MFITFARALQRLAIAHAVICGRESALTYLHITPPVLAVAVLVVDDARFMRTSAISVCSIETHDTQSTFVCSMYARLSVAVLG